MTPDERKILALIRSFYADVGLPPTPSAQALKAWLAADGRLQVGSVFDDRCGVVWLRPLRGGRWYADRAAA
jgi:hypothetical protein